MALADEAAGFGAADGEETGMRSPKMMITRQPLRQAQRALLDFLYSYRNNPISIIFAERPVSPNYFSRKRSSSYGNGNRISDQRCRAIEPILVRSELTFSDQLPILKNNTFYPIHHESPPRLVAYWSGTYAPGLKGAVL
jgi:hypothetical protein